MRSFLLKNYKKSRFISRQIICSFYTSSRLGGVQSQNNETENGNKLLRHLKNKIEATGPISIAEYMKEVLTNPYSGYYMNKDVFGSAGDFITSPEISQMFGELIGLWLFHEWSKIGQPKPFQLVELGPGRGTLAEDILRVFKKLGVSEEVFSLHLVEISPHMQKLQEWKLCGTKAEEIVATQPTFEPRSAISKIGYPITWYQYFNDDDIPNKFTLFLANEFFDALPIQKFKKTTEGWREILIDCKDDKLHYIISRGPTASSKFFISPTEKRTDLEVSVTTGYIIDHITKKIKKYGGISLIVDYGYVNSEKSDTFRGFRNHALHDPLIDPGTADLTADVDFAYILKHASKRAVCVGPVTQASFLKKMGIDIRLQKLLQNCSDKEQEALKTGYDMLVSENKMGERFKFVALFPLVLEDYLKKLPPAGFS